VTSSNLSVQLYTVRESLSDDVPGTIKRLAEIGFTKVEPYNFTAFEGLGEALRANGITAPTTHAHFLGEDPSAVFSAARDLGVEIVIDPHVPAERWQSADSVAEIAAQLNDAAKKAAEYGLRVGYHNHAHELESVIDGTPALELLASQLDPAVALEVDTYWAAVGGVDPVQLLGRLGDRVVALHVKDGPVTKTDKDQVAVGSGTLPIRSIIEAAPFALRVIELDDSRDDRFTAVADSFAYLTSAGLA